MMVAGADSRPGGKAHLRMRTPRVAGGEWPKGGVRIFRCGQGRGEKGQGLEKSGAGGHMWR